MVTGQCLCGSVTWRADGPFSPINHCHCSMCRKAHGAPFASFTSCPVDAFEWTSATDTVIARASSASFVRPFCSTCGSTVPQTTPDGSRVRLPVGCTDMPSHLSGGRNIFAASKTPWHLMGGPEESYDAYPPGMGEAVPVSPTHPEAQNSPPSDTLRGSCLCGTVRFELQTPFLRVHNCHCSLCRRARAAAHTTNGFVPITALKFTAGQDNMTEYTLPGRGFGQTFCATCGSGTPRERPQPGLYSVPLAALDDMPDRGADDHIFTGSMADWYEIRDDLPQFAEGPG